MNSHIIKDKLMQIVYSSGISINIIISTAFRYLTESFANYDKKNDKYFDYITLNTTRTTWFLNILRIFKTLSTFNCFWLFTPLSPIMKYNFRGIG